MIAILGATGTIGRSLARELARTREHLVLYARHPERLTEFHWPNHVGVKALTEFNASPFELVINAIGDVDPARVNAAGTDIVDVSKKWDERILNTMGEGTAYVFLSSGAVNDIAAARNDAERSLAVTPYVLAKVAAEAHHRTMSNRQILDIRAFGYADITLPIESTFFLSELARSVVRRQPIITSPQDMVRDYTGVDELLDLIHCWRSRGTPNIALDLFSKAAVSKRELLNIAQRRYGLQINLHGTPGSSLTGGALNYVSRNHVAEEFGYRPKRTATEIIVAVLDALIAERDKNKTHV